ncbi:MAG: DISARM system phospholipase D-like protein DrmC [Dehalococcoidia bacterium]
MNGAADATALAAAIAEFARGQPAGHVYAAAGVFATAARFGHVVELRAHAAVASPSFRADLAPLLRAWASNPTVTGETLALALRSAAAAHAATRADEMVEVVWTGPASAAVPLRLTRAVLIELIDQAQRRLTVVSFAAYKAPEALAALTRAVARGVAVRLVLESALESGGRLAFDAAAAFAELAGAVDLYVWPAERRETVQGVTGALHAKAVVVDDAAAFITSANLTGHALTVNMELGVLVRGGSVPARLNAHFDELIRRDVLRLTAGGHR